ncbi:MAG: protein kinase [Myxococcota bacterium]
MQPPQGAIQPGAVIADRYRLRRPLGEGGMGTVFEAEHLLLGRSFALKVLRLEKWSPELVQRFQREARALGRLSTPRVAQVTDFGVEPHIGPFYVMELVDGETLEARIEREGSVDFPTALDIAIDTCHALADVHKAGLVHRDLKPGNVALPQSGPVGVKLIDFGLAAAMDDSFMERITKSQQVLGSLPYMAPEQFNGAPPNPLIDLYAVGVLLYEALMGELPFSGPSAAALIHKILASPVPNISEISSDIPPRVESVLHRLMAKDPSKRYPTAEACATALETIKTGQDRSTLGAKPSSFPPARADIPPTMEGAGSAFPAEADVSPTIPKPATPSYAVQAPIPTSIPPTMAMAQAQEAGLVQASEAMLPSQQKWSSGQVVPPTSYTPAAPRSAAWWILPMAFAVGVGAVVVVVVGLFVGMSLREQQPEFTAQETVRPTPAQPADAAAPVTPDSAVEEAAETAVAAGIAPNPERQGSEQQGSEQQGSEQQGSEQQGSVREGSEREGSEQQGSVRQASNAEPEGATSEEVTTMRVRQPERPASNRPHRPSPRPPVYSPPPQPVPSPPVPTPRSPMWQGEIIDPPF